MLVSILSTCRAKVEAFKLYNLFFSKGYNLAKIKISLPRLSKLFFIWAFYILGKLSIMHKNINIKTIT